MLKDCLVPYWWGFEKTCTRETGCLLMDLRCDPPHHLRGRYIKKDRVSRVQLRARCRTSRRHGTWMVIHYVSNRTWYLQVRKLQIKSINANHANHFTLQSCFGEGLPFPHTHSFVTKDSSQQLTTRVLWDRIKDLDTASQPLVRCLVISDMLNSNKLITAHVTTYENSVPSKWML